MNYRQTRNYENLQLHMFPGAGQYDIPQLEPVQCDDVDNWISFNFARTCEEPEIHGLHFFVDDYQFMRLWTHPAQYLEQLKRFQAVCTPDFSTYTDFPMAVQIYNHYRKHWLGAYWQMHGIRVIPTISWSDERSYDWCFDGEPVGGCVAVSSVGTQASPETRELFMRGYTEMMERLQPSHVIMYGTMPKGCSGNITSIPAFTSKWRDYRIDEAD